MHNEDRNPNYMQTMMTYEAAMIIGRHWNCIRGIQIPDFAATV